VSVPFACAIRHHEDFRDVVSLGVNSIPSIAIRQSVSTGCGVVVNSYDPGDGIRHYALFQHFGCNIVRQNIDEQVVIFVVSCRIPIHC